MTGSAPAASWRPCTTQDCWEVEVPFGSGLELAHVLRTIEAWVAERGLGALRYHLDGRAYILRAGEILWSTFAREPVVHSSTPFTS